VQIFHKTVESVVSVNTVYGKACNKIPKQLINLLYQSAWFILVKLGEINMTPLIILNKAYYRVKF